MGDHLQMGKTLPYATSHPSQLSLAIPVWVLGRCSEYWIVAKVAA